MIQNWQKQGLIYSSRAQIPTVLEIDKIWRIYFADRTSDNKSFIRYIDVEAGNPKNILYEHKESVIPWGLPGTFDSSGIMPSWILKEKNHYLMYYIGWTQRKDVPYQNAIGLALSMDNGKTFHKYSEGPILAANLEDPYFVSTPCVLYSKTNYYYMWYLSCTEWGNNEPRYMIKDRYSRDGRIWKTNSSQACIDYKNLEEGGICRPVILSVEDGKIWYCYRGVKDYRTDKSQSYRIGYAKIFKYDYVRKDEEVNLKLSENGWDSEMLCYPFILKHKELYYMFYNGNGFGTTGFGYATLPENELN